MDANQPESSSWLIQFILAALGAAGITLASFFKGLRSNEKPERRVIEAAEITDTKALSARIIEDLTPPIKTMMERGAARDEKITEMRSDVKRLVEIVERMQIRDEEREKAEERARREHWRGPAE